MYEYLPLELTLTGALSIIATLLVPLLAMAWWLWRPGRRGQGRDPLIWSLAAFILMCIGVAWTAEARSSVHDVDRSTAGWVVVGLVVAIPLGITVSVLRLKDPHFWTGVRYAIPINGMVILLGGFVVMIEGISTPRWAADRSQCKNNLKQIGLGMHNYHDMHNTFPAAAAGQPPVSWRVHLLPYLDRAPLYRDYDQSAAWDAPANADLMRHLVPVLTCPDGRNLRVSPSGSVFTSYFASTGANAAFSGDQPRKLGEFADGLSNTIFVLEACGTEIIWTEPRDMDIDTRPIGVNLPGSKPNLSDGILSSKHFGNMSQVLLGDGSVRVVRQDIDPETLRRLLDPNDGLPLEDF